MTLDGKHNKQFHYSHYKDVHFIIIIYHLVWGVKIIHFHVIGVFILNLKNQFKIYYKK